MVKFYRAFPFLAIISISAVINAAEVNSWECSKFKDSKIVSSDGKYLGTLGPSWKPDSIYNNSSEHSSSWSTNSIYNKDSNYGNSYSSESVFNINASEPPKIISKDGKEIGFLSIGPGWLSDRFDPADIKYTCNWD
jgi:hypothetical protein